MLQTMSGLNIARMSKRKHTMFHMFCHLPEADHVLVAPRLKRGRTGPREQQEFADV